MALSTPEKLLREVTQLSKKYEQLFASSDDIKALQGIERCVEMKIKISGLDAKTQQQLAPITENSNSIPLTELPTELLEKLLYNLKNSGESRISGDPEN